MPKIPWQQRLLLFFIIAALVPLFFSSYNIIDIAEDELKSNLNSDLLLNSRDIADHIDDKFDHWNNTFLIQKKMLENRNLSSKEKVTLLYEGLKQLKPFMYCAIYQEDFNGLMSEKVTLINRDYNVIVENNKNFDEKLKTVDTSQLLRNADLPVKYFPERIEKDFWIISVYIPFKFDEKTVGNLVIKLNLDEIHFYLQQHPFHESGEIMVLNKQQQIIFQEETRGLARDESDITRLLASGNKMYGTITFDHNDEKFIGSYAFTDYPDWVVFSETTQDKAYLPLQKILRSIMIWVGIGIIFAILIAWLFYDQISRPIKRIGEASREIAKGNFDVKIEYNVNDSIGVMARNIEEMGTELKSSFEKITVQNRELDEYSKTLEVKVEERTEKLKQSNKDLKEAYMRVLELNKQKDHFLGIAAHDLKNPLASIKGFGELLVDATPEEVIQYSSTIIDSSNNMLDIISGLLDVNRLEQGSFELEYKNFNAAKCLDEVIEQNKRNCDIKRIVLDVKVDSEDFEIVYDRTIFKQVMDNLISNAVKFSPFDSKVSIATEANEEFVRLSVKDQGPGISEDDQKRLYQKFTKLTARPTNNENSTGLGLAIVKDLLELSGGSINCISQLGKGAEFIVKLPVLPLK